MGYSRRSAEKEAFWRLVIDEQESSGLSVRAFCKRESVSEPSFYAWRKELERRDRAGEQQSDALIPVHVVDGKDSAAGLHGSPVSPPSSTLELETPSGFKIRFDRQLDAAILRDLLHVVTSCSGVDGFRGGGSC